MSKAMKKTDEHLPADLSLQEKIAQDLEAAASQVESAPVERIKYAGKEFALPDGATNDKVVGVIVDFVSANRHYPDAYDEKNPTPPNCFAVGRVPQNLVPDQRATEPQSDTCAVCPKNQFESGQGRSKACKNTRDLAIMQEGAGDDSPIWVMSVPPGSIRYYDTYVSTTLKGRFHRPPIAVVTEITMDPNKTFAAPRFKHVRDLTDEEIEFYWSRKDEAAAILLQRPVTTG